MVGSEGDSATQWQDWLEDEDADQALAIYAASLQPSVNAAPPLNTVSDCVSLLWRLNVYGHPVAKHNWDDVAEYSMRVFPQTALAFANVHLALLEAAMGQQAALAERITALDQRMMSGQQPAGSVVADICRAAGAFAEGDYARCVQILEPASGEVTRIGGSHAQREVIEDSLLIALMKCGEVAKASALLDQRLHRRVVPRDVLWRASLKNFA